MPEWNENQYVTVQQCRGCQEEVCEVCYCT